MLFTDDTVPVSEEREKLEVSFKTSITKTKYSADSSSGIIDDMVAGHDNNLLHRIPLKREKILKLEIKNYAAEMRNQRHWIGWNTKSILNIHNHSHLNR